ncbi:MAG: helix-hairpin-helix domain-containing protein [Candidatus Omnitrophica bacterium]|jgi:Holliday junction DNA helicase RuvA|nr:helix-hairpin-helix domain-containing protein [Candidatus Omnitrophota bacterium]
MIARIKGKVIERGDNFILVENSGFAYQVLLAVINMQRLDEIIAADGTIDLITYHYYQVEPSRSTPVLIGFLNEVEKEFFESFITVSGIGPKAALKALNQPISQIARAIDEGDVDSLRSLPGIGQQRAKEVIAKLQNKVGKFGLIQDSQVKNAGSPAHDMQEEVMAVLTQLGYKKPEAQTMIKKALEHAGQIKTSEELLNEVYRQKKIL